MSAPTPRAGFTLIEVLAATTLLAIVTALLLPVVRTATQVETRLASASVAAGDHRTTEQVLRHLLARAQRSPGRGSGQGFDGDTASLSFLTRPAAFEGPQRASFIIENGALTLALRPAADPARPSERATLQSEMDAPAFVYFGDPDGDGVDGWHQTWQSDRLPRLVVLDMARVDGTVRRIEARVGGAAPTDCRFDSGLGLCLGDVE